MPAARISGTIRSKNPLKGAVEVIPERLYYAALKSPPPSVNILASIPKRKTSKSGATASRASAEAEATPASEKKQIHFFQIDNELVYWNFFLDFGPLNLGQLYRFCYKLNEKLQRYQVVCFYSNTVPAKRANAIWLITAWQMLYLGRSPEQAYAGFDAQLHKELIQQTRQQQQRRRRQPSSSQQQQQQDVVMHDAVVVEDDDHDDDHEDVDDDHEGADEGMGQLSAPPVSNSQGSVTVAPLPPFHDASPCACTYDVTVLDSLRGMARAMSCKFFDKETFDVDEYEYFEQVENGDLNWIVQGKILAFAGPSYERHVSPEGYCTLAPADYIPYFLRRNVNLVVRLNKKAYNEQDFVDAGINHVEAFFVDGSCPPMKILKGVLDAFEAVPPGKAFAVHCKAGLGRTGTCIGAYLMKHFQFTAVEAIAWMRICRPGCVIGPQQHFLEKLQPLMWQEGMAERAAIERPLAAAAAPSSSASGNKKDRKSSSSASTSSSNDRKNGTSSKSPTSSSQHPDDHILPDMPDDAVTGREGQAAGLLAARSKRPGGRRADDPKAAPGTPSNRTAATAASTTPPETPEQNEKATAVVTPDGNDSRLWCS